MDLAGGKQRFSGQSIFFFFNCPSFQHIGNSICALDLQANFGCYRSIFINFLALLALQLTLNTTKPLCDMGFMGGTVPDDKLVRY